MSAPDPTVPPRRAFISYSWSSPEHEQWVLDLATELRQSGIDVIIDKWDLREGQDKHAFMEKMVTDDGIDKVIVVCDRKYKEKADGRDGGVGTETQIISKEVYDKVTQTKFVAVISETDEQGVPFLPVYLRSRIYIDLSTAELRAANFEQLVRCVFDKPLHSKPPLGKPPSFILDASSVASPTKDFARRATDAAVAGKANAPAILGDYLDVVFTSLSAHKLRGVSGQPIDDQVVKSLEILLPLRDELLNVLFAHMRHSASEPTLAVVHRFLESAAELKYPLATETAGGVGDRDNIAIFLHELFLYLIAGLIRLGQYENARNLIEGVYVLSEHPSAPGRAGINRFPILGCHPHSLDERNRRLNLRRMLPMADLLKDRARRADLPFTSVMQADFLLFLCATLDGHDWRSWIPCTLVLRSRFQITPFEVFQRATSRRELPRVLRLLGSSSKEQLTQRFTESIRNADFTRIWTFDGFDPMMLMNAEGLGTVP